MVSVIIPCHERSDILRECLKSVCSQTYRPIEVVLVDDASKEDIQQVATDTEWPDGISFIYKRSNENVGPGAAREIGRQSAHGEFICYLDSDDLWAPDKVKLQVKQLQANPDTGMCYCAVKHINFETGEESIRLWSDSHFDSFLPVVLYRRPWSTSSCMWTRKAADEIGSWFSGWHWEDYEYDYRAGCKGIRITHLPEILCNNRKDTFDSLSSRSKRIKILRRAESLFKIVSDLVCYEQYAKSYVRRRTLYNLYKMILETIAFQETEITAKCVRQINELEGKFSKYTLVTRFLYLVGCVFSKEHTAILLGRRFSKYLFPPEVRNNEQFLLAQMKKQERQNTKSR